MIRKGDIVSIKGKDCELKGVVIELTDEKYVKVQPFNMQCDLYVERKIIIKDNSEKYKTSDKLKIGDVAINTYYNLTDVYITGIEETSYGTVYTTACYDGNKIHIERYHENYIIKK